LLFIIPANFSYSLDIASPFPIGPYWVLDDDEDDCDDRRKVFSVDSKLRFPLDAEETTGLESHDSQVRSARIY